MRSQSWVTPCGCKTPTSPLGKISQPFISLSAKPSRREGSPSGSIRAWGPFDPFQSPDKKGDAEVGRGEGEALSPRRQEAQQNSSASSGEPPPPGMSPLGASGIGKEFRANSTVRVPSQCEDARAAQCGAARARNRVQNNYQPTCVSYEQCKC